MGFHERTYIKNLKMEDEGKTVVLTGWVHETRNLGKLRFILLRDSTGIIQVTAKTGGVSEKTFEEMGKLIKESIILLKGKIRADQRVKKGFEIIPEEIEEIARPSEHLPVDISEKIEANFDTRMDWRALDLRRVETQSIFKIESRILEGMTEYLNKNDFVQIFTPCLMGAVSEGGSEVFPVIYFQREAYLRQDPQLHRQLAILGGFDRVYDIGPSWRAELSHTKRHLCEHRGIAVEMAFIDEERDVMRVEEEMIVNTIKNVKKKCADELETLKIDLEVPKTPFPELRFPQIYDVLEGLGRHFEYGSDYDWEAEALLAKYVKEKYNSDFFFVNRFPSAVKPFYVMKSDEDPTFARSVDMIYKGIEQSSGGQREHRYEQIMKQVEEKKLNPAKVKWFTDFFKFGAPPHGGFCLGLERFTMEMLNLDNVREASLFPRDPERLTP